MAQLSSVIGSILRDIISAQHEANLYTLSISENYGKDGKAKDFQLPGVFISEMELDLKYGVISSDESHEQFNIKLNKFRGFVRTLCDEAAKTAITSVISTVLDSDIEREEEDKVFFKRLRKETDLFREFHKFLFLNMRNAFVANLYEAVDTKTGEVNVEVVVKRLMDIVIRKFLNDSDLDKLFEGRNGKELRQLAENNARTAIDGLVRKSSEDSNFKRIKVFPQLNVAVTADELSKMPEDAIHSFKLKFRPTTCNISEPEEDEALRDFNMK